MWEALFFHTILKFSSWKDFVCSTNSRNRTQVVIRTWVFSNIARLMVLKGTGSINVNASSHSDLWFECRSIFKTGFWTHCPPIAHYLLYSILPQLKMTWCVTKIAWLCGCNDTAMIDILIIIIIILIPKIQVNTRLFKYIWLNFRPFG